MAHQIETESRIPNCDGYFEAIQIRKKLPYSLQRILTSAFAQILVSSFPEVPGGKVFEIPADTLIADAVQILSKHKIISAPVTNPEAGDSLDWKERYLGILDYSAVILWVLENAELAAVAFTAGSATATGVAAGAVGALGAGALGATGPAAVAGLTVAAVGAAMAADKGVGGIFHWAPFLHVGSESFMLTVLLLLSNYRLRNVPVIETDKPSVKNFITQSAIVKGLPQCIARDWFDCISARPLSDFGLPFMSYNEVISVRSDELIVEAFEHMKDNRIGGLPVVEGPNRKIVGSVSIHDVRFLLLRPELFPSFSKLTVMDFLRTIASVSADSGYADVSLPVTCPPDASLGTVIDATHLPPEPSTGSMLSTARIIML